MQINLLCSKKSVSPYITEGDNVPSTSGPSRNTIILPSHTKSPVINQAPPVHHVNKTSHCSQQDTLNLILSQYPRYTRKEDIRFLPMTLHSTCDPTITGRSITTPGQLYRVATTVTQPHPPWFSFLGLCQEQSLYSSSAAIHKGTARKIPWCSI